MSQRTKPALAVALVGVLGWMLYSQLSGVSLLSGSDIPELPADLETGNLVGLDEVTSVSPEAVLGGSPTYDLGGRNLFQYGAFKPPPPPPPSPEELERRRKAEEERLKAMEEAAKLRQAEEEARRQEQQLLAEKAMAEAAQQRAKAPPVEAKPQPPPKPPPPAMDLKLVGYLGPQGSRIAVFYTAGGKEIVLGKKGEVIEGKFTVLDIGAESVEMGYVDPVHAGSKKTIQLGK